MPKSETDAIVLSGGGAKGAYEVGVLKALFERSSPPRPAVFTGTSVGSFNSAFIVSQGDCSGREAVARLEQVWTDRISSNSALDDNGVFRFRGDPFRLMSQFAGDPLQNFRDFAEDGAFLAMDWMQRASHLFSSAESPARRLVELIDLSSLVSNEPLRTLIADTIDVESLLESHTALRLATTCWDSGELRIFRSQDRERKLQDYERLLDSGNAHLAVAASAAIPGLFPAVKIADEHYMDGGVVMNTPLKSAIRAGGTTLHVVYLDPDSEDLESGHPPNTLDTMNRLFVQIQAVNTSRDIQEVRRINNLISIHEHVGAAGAPRSTAVRQHLELIKTRVEEEMEKSPKALRRITVHRYRPRQSFGGLLGLLDFRRDRVQDLIQAGYEETLQHRCSESGCVIPA